MFFSELRWKDYSLVCGMLFFLFGERLRLVLEFLTCTAEIWSMFFLSFVVFLILFFNVCIFAFSAVIFVCVGLCTASAYAWSFFAMFSTVSPVLFCFIIAKAEEYPCGLSCTSFCYISGVHGTSFSFLVFSLSEKTISATAIFLSVEFFVLWFFTGFVAYSNYLYTDIFALHFLGFVFSDCKG